MAWNPPGNIGPNEHIGRRIFDEPILAGAQGQPTYGGISLTHFEEKRTREFSLDRLGASAIDKRVVNYLAPRARAAGAKRKKPESFNGWAVLAARELLTSRKGPSFQLFVSPEVGIALDENIYHCHAEPPSQLDALSAAYHLRHLFLTYGKIEKSTAQETPSRSLTESLERAMRFMLGKWNQAFKNGL